MKLQKEQIRQAIKDSNGKIFKVSFIKKDGTKRDMIARTSVRKGLKGGVNTTAAYDKYVTVYDMSKYQYRNINVETIYAMKINGFEFEINS